MYKYITLIHINISINHDNSYLLNFNKIPAKIISDPKSEASLSLSLNVSFNQIWNKYVGTLDKIDKNRQKMLKM